jgi:hypothetical protein
MTVWNFENYDDITRTVCSGGVNWELDANPASFGPIIFANYASIYVAPSGYVGGENFTVYGRMKMSTASENLYGYQMYALANNGKRMAIAIISGPVSPNYEITREVVPSSSNRCSGITETGVTIGIASQINKWVWFKMIYNAINNRARFYYNISDVTSKPSSWIAFGEETVVMDQLTEIGFYAVGLYPDAYIYADDLEVDEFPNPVVGFDPSVLAAIKSIYAMWGTNARGSALVEVGDQENALAATIKGELGKLISFTTPDGLTIFIGEVKSYNTKSERTKILFLKGIGQKFMKNRCKTNPVSDQSFMLRHSLGTIIQDKDANFSSLTDKAITFIKKDLKTLIVFPVLVAYTESDNTTPWVPKYTYGNFLNLYFDEPALTPPNNSLAVIAEGTHAGNDQRVQFTFKPFVLVGSTIDKLILRYKWSFHNPINSNDPTNNIFIYNFTDEAWETLYDYDADPDGVKQKEYYQTWIGDIITGLTAYTEHSIDLLAYAAGQSHNVLEYIDLGGTNNSNYRENQIKIAFSVGDPALNIDPYCSFNIIELTLGFDIDQGTVYGLGKIGGSTPTTLTVTSEGAAVPNLTDLPDEEGFGYGDSVIISDWVDDEGSGIAQDIFNNSDTTLTLEFSAINSNKITELTNLNFEMIHPILQKWADILNGLWWIHLKLSKVVFETPDNSVGSGVTLTQIDAVDYKPGGFAHDIDIANIVNKVTVVGKGEIYKSSTPDPEFPLGGDDEEVIYRATSLNSNIAVQYMANSKKHLHENASRNLKMTLNYSKPKQDYSSIEVGKLISVKLPESGDTSEADYYDQGGGVDKRVTVVMMELNKNKATGDQIFITLTMQRRYYS